MDGFRQFDASVAQFPQIFKREGRQDFSKDVTNGIIHIECFDCILNTRGFPGDSDGKESASDAGDPGSIRESGLPKET